MKTTKMEKVEEAIEALFNDTSVSKAATKSMLKDIKEEIEIKIESLDIAEDEE